MRIPQFTSHHLKSVLWVRAHLQAHQKSSPKILGLTTLLARKGSLTYHFYGLPWLLTRTSRTSSVKTKLSPKSPAYTLTHQTVTCQCIRTYQSLKSQNTWQISVDYKLVVIIGVIMTADCCKNFLSWIFLWTGIDMHMTNQWLHFWMCLVQI